MHDFRLKLSDPRTAPAVRSYLAQARMSRRFATAQGGIPANDDTHGPISINLDLTLACDYQCGHCIDAELLNGGRHLELETVRATLQILAENGLRSVILIGGGEPTLHPHFEEAVAEIKRLDLECAIVSNGAHNDRIASVAHLLKPGDWVRLSLDAGSEEMFQTLHRPRRQITLGHICSTAARVKNLAPCIQLGYSFVVMWESEGQSVKPVSGNIHEMPLAATLAKETGFDYISFKPMLTRDSARAEVVNLGRSNGNGMSDGLEDAGAVEEIRRALGASEPLADGHFRVVPSRNLIALLDGSALRQSALQPRACHMQRFRHVVTPSGVFACPAHRGNERSRVAGAKDYSSPHMFRQVVEATNAQIARFDAASECRQITCIYNEANWWLEEMVRTGEELDHLSAPDLFL